MWNCWLCDACLVPRHVMGLVMMYDGPVLKRSKVPASSSGGHLDEVAGRLAQPKLPEFAGAPIIVASGDDRGVCCWTGAAQVRTYIHPRPQALSISRLRYGSPPRYEYRYSYGYGRITPLDITVVSPCRGRADLRGGTGAVTAGRASRLAGSSSMMKQRAINGCCAGCRAFSGSARVLFFGRTDIC